MVNRLRQYWYEIESSFWFVPGLIISGATLLAIGLINLDAHFGPEVMANWPGFLNASANSARGLLETIASSMITVAGVVFSITLVALSLTSSQYSPRVLRTFMHDRANQAALGVFIGIFAYCLIILRAIRDDGQQAFVPELAVFCSLILGFVGIAVLVAFIHHIASSIQASRILAAVFEETIESIESMFPESLEGEAAELQFEPDHPGLDWHPIPAVQTGYIQQVDTVPLLAYARKHKVVVRLERGIGEFLISGTPAVSVLQSAPPEGMTFLSLNSAFTVGRQRTVNQDAAFGIRQLVDVALKGLSPGVNDTTTAVMAVDYLTAILVHLADRRLASPYLIEDGELRLLLRVPTYDSLTREAFQQIRLYAEGKTTVIARLFEALEVVAGQTDNVKRRQVLLQHARAIEETVHRSIASPSDRKYLNAMSRRVIALLDSEKPG